VRPVLNLKQEKDLKAMRAIAEEAFALVKQYKGSHSGEHGDGIVRSEFHEPMFGARLVRAFGEVKGLFDPDMLFNPGKIVGAPKFDDRDYLRFNPNYGISAIKPVLDWSEYPGGASGFQGAVEMCNNNGACRKHEGGAMCPSYRATMNERDVTRGRANSLRLALSGQLGPDAFASDDMMETLKLCVSCKACRRECPTGVDMAKMKIEVLAARAAKNGLSLRDKLIAYLPRYAATGSGLSFLFNLRDQIPGVAKLTEMVLGLTAKRPLPRWRNDVWAPKETSMGAQGGREVVLFGDTFNRYYERENLDAALSVLVAAGYRVHMPKPVNREARPLCCGRTFLSSGLVNEARAELTRTVAALLPYAKRGVPILGLEPSCLFTFRDELQSILPGEDAKTLAAQAMLFEEFVAKEMDAKRFNLALSPIGGKAMLHGHCHQKSFAVMGPVQKVLKAIPGLNVELIESSCCGMAGSFGYQAETIDVSLKMAEISLLPAVRKAAADTLIVADGTSCRSQIEDGTGREAIHVARVLAKSMSAANTAN
jgi:Fe-S oxidoreductase